MSDINTTTAPTPPANTAASVVPQGTDVSSPVQTASAATVVAIPTMYQEVMSGFLQSPGSIKFDIPNGSTFSKALQPYPVVAACFKPNVGEATVSLGIVTPGGSPLEYGSPAPFMVIDVDIPVYRLAQGQYAMTATGTSSANGKLYKYQASLVFNVVA